MHAKNKFEWCLRKAKEGGHGIKKIKPDLKEAKFHIEKALYNLKVMDSNIKLGYKDWAVSSAFYAMYHAVLALLYKKQQNLILEIFLVFLLQCILLSQNYFFPKIS